MSQFDSCSLCHVHRERNSVADLLAKDSTNSCYGAVFLRHPPAHIVPAVLDDIAQVGSIISVGLSSSSPS